MTKEITIGSTVRIVDNGDAFTTYDKWATEHGLTKFVDGGSCHRTGAVGTVVAIGPHRIHQSYGTLYAVEFDGKQVIYGKDGIELVAPAVANGVDANGKPLHFTREDLKPLQRVVTADGRKGIIVTEGVGDYIACVIYDANYGSFDPAQFDGECYETHPEINIVEVYENPGYGKSLRQDERGELVWKKDARSAALVAADKAIAEAEVALAAAKAAKAAI